MTNMKVIIHDLKILQDFLKYRVNQKSYMTVMFFLKGYPILFDILIPICNIFHI